MFVTRIVYVTVLPLTTFDGDTDFVIPSATVGVGVGVLVGVLVAVRVAVGVLVGVAVDVGVTV